MGCDGCSTTQPLSLKHVTADQLLPHLHPSQVRLMSHASLFPILISYFFAPHSCHRSFRHYHSCLPLTNCDLETFPINYLRYRPGCMEARVCGPNWLLKFPPFPLCSLAWIQLFFRSVYKKDIRMEKIILSILLSLKIDTSSLSLLLLMFSNSLDHSQHSSLLAVCALLHKFSPFRPA